MALVPEPPSASRPRMQEVMLSEVHVLAHGESGLQAAQMRSAQEPRSALHEGKGGNRLLTTSVLGRQVAKSSGATRDEAGPRARGEGR